MLQVVMRLLGNLDGISPASYPRPVFDIAGQLMQRARLGALAFVIVHNDVAPPPVPPAVHNASSVSTGAAAAAGTLDDTASSHLARAHQQARAATSCTSPAHQGRLHADAPQMCGGVACAGAGAEAAQAPSSASAGSAPCAEARHIARRAQREQLQRGTYRGRARVGRVWLSSTHYGDTKRLVKARCAEELLSWLQSGEGLLTAVSKDEHGAPCSVAAPTCAGARSASNGAHAWLAQLQRRRDLALDAKLPQVAA